VYTPAKAQTIGTGTFRDGVPVFLRIDTDPNLTRNVQIDSVVSLSAQSITDRDTSRFLLSGIDWRYTQTSSAILSAEDIDKIPGQNLYLITDGIGRRLYLIRASDQVSTGEFGGPQGTPEFLEKPLDAFPYVDNNRNLKVVITDQGRHRVIQVDWLSKTIDWQYGGALGSGPNQLSSPSDAVSLNNGTEALICDTGNNRVIVIDTTSKAVLWNFGGGALNMPVDVEVEAATGLFLITDQNNHRVILVQRSTSQIVWQFGTGQMGSSDSTLNAPTDADVLPNGNVLICDAGNNRLIEVNRQKQIVYRFAHPLLDLRDADRIIEGPDIDKTLVVANNRPISQSIQPFRLAYFNETFVSGTRDFSRPVNYDSLRFRAIVQAGIAVRLRLRSANVLADLQTAPWLGPTSTTDFYAATTTANNPDTLTVTAAINPAHDGHRFYQFQAFLETANPLLTPRLLRVEVQAHFFDTASDGLITSEAIRDSLGKIITSWQMLIFNTVLPTDPQQRSQVQIEMRLLDEQGTNVLQGFSASSTTPENIFNLAQVEPLRRRQALRLQARLKTNNSSVTPRLNDWRLDWQNTRSTASRIRFTDANNQAVSFYRVPHITENPPLNLATVFVTLEDVNLLPIENAVSLQIRAQRSGDLQTALLTIQPSGQYTLRPGFPAVVSNFTGRENGILEVRDRDALFNRDTLTVRYVDPTDPADSSSARIAMIRSTPGDSLRVENVRGARVDTVAVGDTLYVHLFGETDRDFTPAQDSVVATLINPRTNDLETLTLYEIFNDTARVYTTGEFRSRIGIPILNVTGVDNDGRLHVFPGDQIRAEYVDLDNTKLQRTVQVRPQPQDTTIFILAGNKAFEFFVAPNPFSTRRGHDRLRLAAVANSGDMTLQRIEIYNLAGERIRTIPGDGLRFSGQAVITRRQPAFAENWWDFRTDNGALAAAGTYWAKFYALLTDQVSGRTQAVTTLRKFVIIR
jgi:hypothetical protein